MRTVHLLVKGKVQGVYYRASAKERADDLSVVGWVKNTPAGDVEIMATGEEDALIAFIAWCKKGPVMARVAEVKEEDRSLQHFNSFDIVR